MYYTSYALFSAKSCSSVLMKAYVWSTNDGNASWTVNVCQGPWQGTKPASGKSTKCSYYSYYACKKGYSTTAH